MTERQLEFRVGLFVITALAVGAGLVFQFGEFRARWQPHYSITVHFDSAPGVRASAPVQMNGVTIGRVTDVRFDERRGGIVVLIDIREQFRLRADCEASLVRSLLGDTTIEFTPGTSPDWLTAGMELEGLPATDPLEIVRHLDVKVSQTLDSFADTSHEWQLVGSNLNGIMETNQGHLSEVIERAALALDQFTVTMRTADKALGSANQILGDPQYHAHLRQTLEALPLLVRETQLTIAGVRKTVALMHENLDNLRHATTPLAQQSTTLITRMNNSLAGLESLMADLNQLSDAAITDDGSLHKLMSDPELYRNLNASAESLALLLKNLEPAARDLRIFSDKVARHPEVIGVSGAINGSSGLKDPPEFVPATGLRDPGGLFRR